MRKKILVLANKYPNDVEPTTNMFIQQLAWEFADQGFECEVVCPMPVNFNMRYLRVCDEKQEITENGNRVKVYYPKYLSLGQSGRIMQKFRVRVTTKLYEIAVGHILNQMDKKPDYIYSYFLCPTSVVASRLGIKYNIPAYMEHGEGLYAGDEKYGNKQLKKELRGLTGVIAVSNQNKGYVVDSGIVDEKKVTVYPNYREERFYPMDKAVARQYFGWNDEFVVGYAGRFDEEKGILRIQKAVDQLEGVQFACAGSGKLVPTSPKCIWKKPILQKELVYFYNALDVFVLPTLVEGSCTATAEAIGCGCPIISSDRSFNENLCDETNSILIDPNSVEEIKNAIEALYNDRNLLQKLSKGSLEKAKKLRQRDRMKAVICFMEDMERKT